MRTCIKCGIEQPIEVFGRHSKTGKPLHRCRSCRAEYQRVYQKNRWDNEPGYKERLMATNKKNKFLAQYGMTPDEAAAMLESQGGKCAICRRVPQIPNVDHDHTTGAVRAILCAPCNVALGLFNDDKHRIVAAARYIQAHTALGNIECCYPAERRSGYPAVDVTVEV